VSPPLSGLSSLLEPLSKPQAQRRKAGLRHGLALLRLGLILAIGCFWLLGVGLTHRAWREAGGGLHQPLPAADDPAMQLPFRGLTTQLKQSDPVNRRQRLAELRQLGFGWVRQRLDWGVLEPEPGQFDWQSSDALLADLVAADLIPVVVLDGSPAWARDPRDQPPTDNPLAPPVEPAAFARFAAAFATRYQAQVRFYQIWDEPNVAPHWGQRRIEPIEYAQLLKQAAAAIRQTDPEAVILTAALAPTVDRGHTAIDEVYFLQRLYAAGAAPFFDAVAVQAFGFGTTPTDPRARAGLLNFQRLKLVRQAMVAAGDGATPLWAVRYGWNSRFASPWATVTPAEQVAFATTALDVAYAQWPWLAAMGWLIDQPAAPPDDPIWGFALTPELAQALSQWQPPSAARPPPAPPAGKLLRFLLLTLGGLLIAWRGAVIAYHLPWPAWRIRYQTWPFLGRLALWGLLISLYFVATWPPLILLCWVVAAGLVAIDPLAGVVVAALVTPFYFQHKEIWWLETRMTVAPAHVLALVLLPTLLWSLALRRKQLKRAIWLIDWCALFWLAISVISLINVWHWPAYGRGFAEWVIAPLILFGAVRLFVQKAESLRRVAGALCVGGLLVALFGLIDWFQGGGTAVDGLRRLVGPYFSANHAALYLERTLFLGVGLALAAQGRWRLWWFGAVALVGAALLLTASRGALLLALPVGFVFLLGVGSGGRAHKPYLERWRSGNWRLALLGVGMLALLLLIALSLLWPRLSNSATVTSRFQIWQNTAQLWSDFPLFGVGAGGFFWRYPAYLAGPTNEPNILHPHNLWLEIAATWGVMGLLWFGLLLAGVLRLSRRQAVNRAAGWLKAGLLAGLAAGLAHAQVDAFGALPDLALWNWITLGLLVNGLGRAMGQAAE
jgi:O-antigen ligase